VHTSFWLVPPQTYFEQHPDWYSLIDGKRRWDKAQLCWTNPDLRAFLVERVRQILRENPQAQIISISQEDWTGACQCDRCRAVEEREGSAVAPILETVNLIAERLEREFPHVAFDTLAYWYTRKPTRTLRPRPNVIVRLCSIECSFAQPLERPDNAGFADDIRGWSERCDRLYVWDYTTNFTHYLLPHPNYFVLGANLRFFHRHSVRGVFEQGAYQSHGGEMAELKAWLLAQLLWNPYQDDARLIGEFVRGYYGAAARYVKQYLRLMADAARDFKMGCFTNPADAPYASCIPRSGSCPRKPTSSSTPTGTASSTASVAGKRHNCAGRTLSCGRSSSSACVKSCARTHRRRLSPSRRRTGRARASATAAAPSKSAKAARSRRFWRR
jgi:hypothetical protein